MAEDVSHGFQGGVTIPVRSVGAGSSIHSEETVVMPRVASGTLLQTAVQVRPVAAVPAPVEEAVRADYIGGYDLSRAIAKGGDGGDSPCEGSGVEAGSCSEGEHGERRGGGSSLSERGGGFS